MKTVSLKKKDAYDLFLVYQGIINQKAPEIDFKDIISLQKFATSVKELVSDFSEKVDSIDKQRQDLVKLANEKISEFRTKQSKAEFTENTKKALDEFVQSVLADSQQQVLEEIQPKYDALYKDLGEDSVKIEIEESKMTLVLGTFEKFSKELYNNKAKMVETYETLSAAQTK